MKVLIPEPLTAEAFAPFGDVIERAGRNSYTINYGKTERFSDLALLDTLDNGGKPTVSIFRSQPAEFPMCVLVMERHPMSSQAFIAMERKPFLTIVAPRGERPEVDKIRLFIVGAEQGINYHRGVWHHYLFSPEGERDFLCLDRTGGMGKNCDEHYFDEEIIVGTSAF